MKKLTSSLAALKIPCPILPALSLGERAGVSAVPNLFFLALLALVICFSPGCSALPSKREMQPQAQYLYEPPPPAAPAPTVKTSPAPGYTGGSSPPDSRLADLASQFEALRARLQVVEGKLAEQENQLNQLARAGNPEQRSLRDQVTALQRDLAATQERLARLEGGRHSPSPPSPAPQEIPPPQAAAKTEGDPFQDGMGLFKQKSYGPAREKFQQYLKDHPKGDKAVEARYYLADSLLQDKKYDEAVVEFNKIVEGSPKSSFAPAALLKQAQAFKAQGKTKISHLVLEKLIADYPKSSEAAQARRLQGNR